VRLLLLALVALGALAGPAHSAVLRLGVDAQTLAEAVAAAQDGDEVVIPPGRWPGTVRLERAITLRGAGGTVDGGGVGSTIVIASPGARVLDLTVTNSGHDVGRSDACIYLEPGATGAVVSGNELPDCAFGIWVHQTVGAEISDNHVVGREDLRPTDRGNGIHLFDATELTVRGNHVEGARDGIYVSATEKSLIEDNLLERQRFGVHYMYSYENTLRGNRSNDNIIGFALMESLHLVVEDNQAIGNTRNGLLFRDVQFTEIRRNRLERNGTGLFFYSSTENVIEDNVVVGNEVGIKIWAGTRRNVVEGNRISGNRQQVFYVGAEDQIWGETGRGNYWSDYLGWDQDGDGVGDRPHRIDSFVARLLHQYPATVLLLRSPALEMLSHMAERLSFLRTATIVDQAPLLGGGAG
jgi:nitrous oxidase accessory protein